ncbi:MCE family protein [Streptomyces sp. SID6673]|nr:MCE family protein [Streptomyces sp. SID11726]NEB24209.1 MCE family protein [Streptomyces sp. SID6673]
MPRMISWRTAASTRDSGPRWSDLQWGIAGLAVLLVVALTIVLISTVDLNSHEYRAETTDAGSIRVGDDVRVAGINVGKVTAVDLRSDHVDLRFTADDNVFVGSESTLGVRMLTAVGGYYLALQPAGTTPLGDRIIPRERVVLPYDLPELFQDAVTPLDEIDGGTMRRTMASLRSATVDNPSSIRRAIDATDTIVALLNRQNSDISRTLAMADEYVSSIDGIKSRFGRIIWYWNSLEDSAEESMVSVGSALGTVASLLARLSPISRQWNSKFKPMAQELANSVPPLQELGAKLSDFLDSIRRIGGELRSFGGGADPVTICVPTPERRC